MYKRLNFGGDPDHGSGAGPDHYRDTGKTCFGGDMRCPSASRPPYGIVQAIIFLPCDFLLSSSSFSSPNLNGRRLDVYHTSTHGVALVRI